MNEKKNPIKTMKISMKTKLAAAFTLIAVILCFIGALFIIGGGSMIAENRQKRSLRSAVLSRAESISEKKLIPSSIPSENGISFAVYTKEGKLLIGDPLRSDDGADPLPDSKHFTEITSGGKKYFVFDKKCSLGKSDGKKVSVYLRGYINYPESGEVMSARALSAAITIPTAVILLCIAAYLAAKKILSPLGKLQNATNAIISGDDLSKTIRTGDNHDEVYELTCTINEMLARLSRSFENEKQFISDASHELRTPTSVISAQCELLKTSDTPPTAEEYSQAIDLIARQSERMKRLVLELLELSRIDRGKVEKRFESCDMSRLVSLVCDEQKELHADSTITLTADIEPKIFADVNSSLIIRLATNLISNAYQYGKDGGHINVSLSIERPLNTLVAELVVEDDGIGISKENLPKIWERFFRAEKSRSDTGSSGLGLTMVKWIAGYHDGSVRVESTLGKGSKFTADIPISHKSQTAASESK